ncbi:AAA family ATPase [Diaporthe sp. PMI_573]|nr:AAA family ATPase [Diaporthaceae sp. PMI_573]
MSTLRIYRKTRQICYAKTTKERKEKFRKYALVIRRILDPRGLPQGIEIDVKSPKLAAVLKDIFRDIEKLMVAESDTSPVVSPDALFLVWDRLEKLQEDEKSRQPPDAVLLGDLDTALAYLEKDYGKKRSELKGLLGDGLITFDFLGNLFTPNSVLYTDKNDLKEDQLMKFSSGEYGQRQGGEKFYVVHASIITHDGESLGWGKVQINLPFFKGNMRITDLNVFPLENWEHSRQESIRQDLTNRGREFVALLEKPVCKWYGTTALCSKRLGMEWEEAKFLADKRVMIDPPSWVVHNNSWDVSRYPIVPNKRNSTLRSVGDEDLLFCNHRILGFSFEAKRWGAFAVSKLNDPKWKPEAFGKVILPSQQRYLIRDLVLSHRTPKEDNDIDDDIINGKGQGLVGLLSGKPGVGKTLTAEAVAEVSQRPLYAVSAGELGTKADDVDRQLRLVLDITRRWRCVLLIDEADVFLHTREDNVSLERNAVVSVFLRHLEYFRGVAILTTNRRVDIDVAFMSKWKISSFWPRLMPAFLGRIHFKFDYEDLASATMLGLWKNFLAKEISTSGGSIDEADLGQLAEEYVLNGREIKNAAFCAKSISRIRKTPLSLQDVKDVIENLGFVPGMRQQDLASLAKRVPKRAATLEENGEAEPFKRLKLSADA